MRPEVDEWVTKAFQEVSEEEEEEIDLGVLTNSQPKLQTENRMHMCDNHDKSGRTRGGCQAIKSRNLLLACGGCRSVFYCNATCQRQDWARGHSKECAKLVEKQRREAAKAKRRAQKLLKAKKEAEENNASFNASLTLMFMDDSSSSSGSDREQEDEPSVSLNSTSVSRTSEKDRLHGSQKGPYSSQGSLEFNQLSIAVKDPSSSSRKKK